MSHGIRLLKVSAWPFLVGGVVLILLSSGCAQSNGRGFTGNLNGTNGQSSTYSNIPSNPYPASFVNGLNSAINQSDVSSSDAQALRNYVGGASDVNPQQVLEAFDAQLKAEMKKIQDAEKKGFDQTAQRMAIGKQAVEACANRAAALWPKPGQPLVGEWAAYLCAAGNAQGKEIRFIVGNEANPKGQGMFQYSVQGDIRGVGTAQSDGTMIVDAGDWNGYLTDRGGFRGEMLNQKFLKKGNGYDTCKIKPRLIRSVNPIPANAAEFARQYGLCNKRAIAFMSPMMGNIFNGMDPALAQFLQMKMLGLN